METKEYKTIFKLRRANANQWPSDYILQDGEPGFELDTGKLKIGNNNTPWSQLPYIAADGNSTISNNSIIYIDFELTTNAQEEEILTTESTFNYIETQVETNKTIIGRIEMENQILYAPLLERPNPEAITPTDTFLFGTVTNNIYKIFSIDENNDCTVSEINFGGGTSFSVEPNGNMLFENGVLKARYGEPISGIDTLYSIDESAEMNGPNTYITFADDPTLNLLIISIENNNNAFPLVTADPNSSTPLILIIHYTDNTTRTITMSVEDQSSISPGIYGAGDPEFVKLFEIDHLSQGEIENFLTYIQEHPDSYMFMNHKIGEETEIFFFLPLSYALSSSEQGYFSGITVQSETTTGYPIPPSALRAGEGISINPTSGAISLNFGQKLTDDKKVLWEIGGDTYSIQKNTWINNWYWWQMEESLSQTLKIIDSNLLNPLSIHETYIMQWWRTNKEYNQEDENIAPGNIITESSKTSIDYDGNDDYFYTNIYYGDTGGDYELIQCKQLPYNNPLYTLLDDIIKKDNQSITSDNTFFWGSYNCEEDWYTAVTTGTLTPQTNDKYCFAICLLVQSDNLYFFIASPNDNYPFNRLQGNKVHLFDFKYIPYYKSLSPTAIIQRGNDNSGQESTVFGHAVTAKGIYSTAFGIQTMALGEVSMATGWQTIAAKPGTVAMGISTIANGYSSVAMGTNTIANGEGSLAIGTHTITDGKNSLALGSYTKAAIDNGIVIGEYNNLNSTAIFQIGKGIPENRYNSFEIDSNGQAIRFDNQGTTRYEYWDDSRILPYTESLSSSADLESVIAAYNGLITNLKNYGLMRDSV